MTGTFLQWLKQMVVFSSTVRKACGHSYLASALTSESSVLDLGANVGAFSRYLVDRHGCKCFCVEPDSANFESIKISDRISKLAVAIGDSDGWRQLRRSENAEAHSIFPNSYTSPDEKDSMPVVTASYSTLVAAFGLERIDLMKLDVEGSEWEFLESMSDTQLADNPQITVEFHDFIPEMKQEDRTWRIRQRLQRLGFRTIMVASSMDVLFVNGTKLNIGWRDRICFWMLDNLDRLGNWRYGLKRRLTRVLGKTAYL